MSIRERIRECIFGTGPKPTDPPAIDEDLLVKADLLDRFEKSRVRIEDHALTQINKAWTTFDRILKYGGTLIVLTTGFVAIFGIRSCNDLTRTIDNQLTNFQATIDQRMTHVASEMDKQISHQFQTTNIQALVHNEAKARITEIADPIILTNIARSVKPLLDASENQLKTIQHRLTSIDTTLEQSTNTAVELRNLIDAAHTAVKDANAALLKLEESSDFTTKTILASHDNRAAFDTLMTFATNRSHPRHATALAVVRGIQYSYYKDSRPFTKLDSAPFTNDIPWDLTRIHFHWRYLESRYATAFIRLVSAQTNISQEQRLVFLRNAYLKDSRNSLQAANHAAMIVASNLNATYNPPLLYNTIEQAWHQYYATNHLHPNVDTDTNWHYTIVLSNDTNRLARINMHGGHHVAVILPTPVQSDAGIHVILLNGLQGFTNSFTISKEQIRANAAYFVLSDWLSDEDNPMKFDFRYRPDPQNTNTMSLENMMRLITKATQSP